MTAGLSRVVVSCLFESKIRIVSLIPKVGLLAFLGQKLGQRDLRLSDQIERVLADLCKVRIKL